MRRNGGRGRGVSDIVATILVVAIVVVLAAVLYILISGYLSALPAQPKSVTFANEKSTTTQVGTTVNYYVWWSLSLSGGMSTSDLGFKITTGQGAQLTLGAPAPGTCNGTFTPASGSSPPHGACAAPVSGAWYGVLENGAGDVVSIWTGSGWTGPGGTGNSTVSIVSGDTLVVVSGGTQPLAGSGDTLSVYGAVASVSGTTVL